MKRYREENRPIVYLDESYILSTHVCQKGWTDDSAEGLKTALSKGQRAIIVHAGGEMGFIPNALLIWKSGSSSGDYHNQMNHENFMKWAGKQLVPNLCPNSIIVMDNAPYHNVEKYKVPTSNSKKADMIAWLNSKGIPFNRGMLKPELYKLIKIHKPNCKKYEFDYFFKPWS